MRLLLDENLPKKLKQDFSSHEIFTIHEMGWSGKSNGSLLQLMVKENFDALITFDKNLQYQQNFKKYTVTVFVLVASDNTYLTLKNLVPVLSSKLNDPLSSGPVEIKISV